MPKGGIEGNTGGKKGRSGRKSKAEELGLQALLDKCWTKREREACIKKLSEDAKSKDFKERNEARKLLLAYTFGRPKERHDIDVDIIDPSTVDYSQFNDYELVQLGEGADLRTMLARAGIRRAREKAQATGEDQSAAK